VDHALSSSPGFDYERVVAISPGLSNNGYTPAQSRDYLLALGERLRVIPGVQSVSLALSPPLGRVTITAGAEINGRRVEFEVNRVSAGYFETMSIPILRGRDVQPNERHVAVISQSMAGQAWPAEDPLGKSFDLGERFTVVGIAGSVRSMKFGQSSSVQAYLPIEEANWPSLALLAKSAGSPKDLARSAIKAAQALDGNTHPGMQLLSRALEDKLKDTGMARWP
jgi:hypothetical protein